jgi:hypothetical protein
MWSSASASNLETSKPGSTTSAPGITTMKQAQLQQSISTRGGLFEDKFERHWMQQVRDKSEF